MFNVKSTQPTAVMMAMLIGAGAFASWPFETPHAQPGGSCQIATAEFGGWPAQQMTNQWLKLTFVPKLGGRLMQVAFAGHPFLFVNPQYRGKYLAPSEDTRHWINYGGDKIWPMPEGSQDPEHWPGPYSGVLDDGDYSFQIASRDSRCAVRLDGPPDARTGLQYSREISIGSDSPQISFHATMKNASTHPIRWSVQSVTQYDTADASNGSAFNHNFWAFTPVNEQSAYLDRYHVRAGLADDPSFSVKDGMFSLHWLYLQAEVWIDSPAGWVAVVDSTSKFAIVERLHFEPSAEYPGKATVIFYKNGPSVGVDSQGKAAIHSSSDDAPFYMEAELNSPMIRLSPGESYTFDTEWFPTRAGSDLTNASSVGVTGERLRATAREDNVELTGTLGVFFPGRIVAHFVDNKGEELGAEPLQEVDPAEIVKLQTQMRMSTGAQKISLRLLDREGKDMGELAEAEVHDGSGGS